MEPLLEDGEDTKLSARGIVVAPIGGSPAGSVPCRAASVAAAAAAASVALAHAAAGSSKALHEKVGDSHADVDCQEDGLLDGREEAQREGTRQQVQPCSNHSKGVYQLGVPYLVYCCVCLLLTGVLLMATLWEDFAPRREVRFWGRQLRPWEEAGEALVGAALCVETIASWRLSRRVFFQDGWRILDAVVAGLTLMCGAFFFFRRLCHNVGQVVQDVDVPMLGLRFAMQPIRMFSTASMVVRAHRLHQAARPPLLQAFFQDPRHPEGVSLGSMLTPRQASNIRELLPAHLRFEQWHLAYSPKVHGTSLNTFYRQQAGPNILVVRDAHGGLFGGFASEPWRPQAGAYGHSGESFVFAARKTSRCESEHSVFDEGGEAQDHAADADCSKGAGFEVFWAPPHRGNVLQWGDAKTFGFGRALLVCEDFLRGSSCVCEAFGSPQLSPAGTDFIIRDFECWHVGGGGE